MEVSRYVSNGNHFNSEKYLLIGSKKLVNKSNLLQLLTFTNYLIVYPYDVIGQRYVYKDTNVGQPIKWDDFISYFKEESFISTYHRKFDYWCDILHLSFFKSINDHDSKDEILDLLKSWQFLLQKALKKEVEEEDQVFDRIETEEVFENSFLDKLNDALIESRTSMQMFEAKIMILSEEVEKLENDNIKLKQEQN
ncbi:hypothetical protein HANVADRAFT_54228 [Hanseniaspora valbyensis NRRL Y-1626]|uniref:Uncharacterized protein n=1 Tax=Hanseniaspora valbyensis NRRL Y-1626 TaxID=766949 RepID=A0A1B7T846_9ASCO|nr:hypothetical protein HANVADRAFT_54228 [Hanseniaspora valbyensis NRRL Y-1626]